MPQPNSRSASHGPPQKRGKLYFALFLLLSFVCLAIALYEADYLHVPTTYSVSKMLLSVILLLAAFGPASLAWQYALLAEGHRVSFRTCIASTGLSVFGKYIPGKVWLAIGRASYVAQLYNLPTKRLSVTSLNVQLLGIWTALSISGIGLAVVKQLPQVNWIVAAAWLTLTVALFTSRGHELAGQIARSALKREVNIPYLGFATALKLTPFWLMSWALRGAAFYFLVCSLVPNDLPLAIALAFPLAVSLGMIAFFVPGGLGVREGLIAAYLIELGMIPASAVSIAIVARLWTLVSEILIFLVSAVIHVRTSGVQPETMAKSHY